MPQNYLQALHQGVKGLRIGVLKEGFGLTNSDPRSDRLVRQAIGHYQQVGTDVSEVSLPLHFDGCAIHSGIVMEGATQMIFQGNGQGDNRYGRYTTSLVEAFGSRWRSRPDELPTISKAMLFMGMYMRHHYHGRFHAKTQNLRFVLKAAYDELLKQVDILALPTIPHPADELPSADNPLIDLKNTANLLQNAMPFNVTDHPAFSLPCGKLQGLPVGLMLVGRMMDDTTLISAAQSLANSFNWQDGQGCDAF